MRTLVALVAVAVGGVMAVRCLPRESRDRLASRVRLRMIKHMEQMLASLPEDAPPRLIMSILPKLKAQNDQIIAMLTEQNEILRARQR